MGCSSSSLSEPEQQQPRYQHTQQQQQQQQQTSPKQQQQGGKKTNGATAGGAALPSPASTGSKAQQVDARTASQVKVDQRLAQIQPNEEVGRMLKSVPLLSKLSDAERAKLGGAVVERSFADGQRLITQGEAGNGFFIIRKGNVTVSRMDESGKTTQLATLKDGDVCGETALINNAKRGATVTAVGPVSTFYLERQDFEALFGKSRLNVQFAKVTRRQCNELS